MPPHICRRLFYRVGTKKRFAVYVLYFKYLLSPVDVNRLITQMLVVFLACSALLIATPAGCWVADLQRAYFRRDQLLPITGCSQFQISPLFPSMYLSFTGYRNNTPLIHVMCLANADLYFSYSRGQLNHEPRFYWLCMYLYFFSSSLHFFRFWVEWRIYWYYNYVFLFPMINFSTRKSWVEVFYFSSSFLKCEETS